MPKQIGLLHFYAYLNQAENLEQALEDGQYYHTNSEGKSPLLVAIERQSFAVVEKILKYIKDDQKFGCDIKLTEKGVHKLLDYQSGQVKDAMEKVFHTSTFLGEVPMNGYLLNYKTRF